MQVLVDPNTGLPTFTPTPDTSTGVSGHVASSGGGAVDSVNTQTGVVVLDTDDIADTATNRYTNDTDATRLANTSGTNTGDVANTAITTDGLDQFAATTSAQLAGVLSDETGTGVAVFGTSPTFTTDITTPLIYGGTATTDDLVLWANSQPFDTLDTGRIRIESKIEYDKTYTMDTYAESFFNIANHTQQTLKGTYTAPGTANNASVVGFSAVQTLSYSSTMLLASAPAFQSNNIIQPTAAVNDALTFWTGYLATSTWQPNLATAITANTSTLSGYEAEPYASMHASSHASSAGTIDDLCGFGAWTLQLKPLASDARLTIDNASGLKVRNPTATTQAGTLTNLRGIAIDSMTRSTNNTDVLFGTLTSPTGNWGLYQGDAYDNLLNAELSMSTHKITDVVDPTAAQDVATKQYVDDNAGGVTASPGAFISTGSTDITSTAATVVLNTEVFDPDTNYTNSSGEVNVTAAGYYHVDMNVPVNDDGTSGGARAAVSIVLQKDGGSGTWADVDHIRGQDYAREDSDGEGVNASGIVSLLAGEDIRIRIQQSSNTDISTVSAQSSLNIHKIRNA